MSNFNSLYEIAQHNLARARRQNSNRGFSRLSNEEVRRRFEKYGFSINNDFLYQNVNTPIRVFDEVNQRETTLSINQLNTLIRNGRQEYTPLPLMNAPLSEEEPRQRNSFNSWLQKQSEEVQNLTQQEQMEVYSIMQDSLKQFSKRRNFTINFNNFQQVRGFVEAVKIFGPRLGNMNARLTFINSDGFPDYRYLSPSTIEYLNWLFNTPNLDRIEDSNNDLQETIMNIQSIKVEFVQREKGKRKTPGFFPYLNKSDIDLRKYGIFSSIKDIDINDSCLIQAFKYSNILTEDELKMLISFIKTRYVPQTVLKEIAELFKIHINCMTYYENGKVSHSDYGEDYKELRYIKILIYNNHYILNEKVMVSDFYIKHYNEINKDNRFKNHSRKHLLKQFDANRYKFTSRDFKGMHIVTLIKLMITNNLLIPMNSKQTNYLEWSYKPKNEEFEGISRLIHIPDKQTSAYKQLYKVKQTNHFFGYKPDEDEVDLRIWELQKVVNQLPLRNRIDVSLYYKFSELMQKIMFEYGCYDEVYEYSGSKAKYIREQCIFPKMGTPDGKPLYRKEKLYYIDLNGAYMAAVKSIPKQIGSMDKGENTKIKELIETLYKFRIDAKKQGNVKLATTLKFMMNSCWGYSIQRPKLIKHKYCKNVNNYVETYAPYVVRYSYNQTDGVSGYVDTINPFVQHFSFPQFAKSVLDEFNRMISNIKNIVNILYQNVDAILITESDYNKLVKLGYIGNELGQFKIEHIFTEIAIKSKKRYVGILEDGSKYYHCVKESEEYEEFINSCKY